MIRNPEPSMLLVDSQSVKTNHEADDKDFEGNKKVKGRKRQIATDTLGNIWPTHIHVANLSDTKECCLSQKKV